MKRPLTITKYFLFVLVIFFLTFGIHLFSEFILNDVELKRCHWPELQPPKSQSFHASKHVATAHHPLRAMIITDTHLLGSRTSVWLDRKLRDWFLFWSFQSAVKIHRPDVIFILGDITDEGLYALDAEFAYAVERFQWVFAVPHQLPMYILVGNHDIGFHYEITQLKWKRFNRAFNTTDVRLISIRGVHFVTINSVAMHADDCFMCAAAEEQLDEVEHILKCTVNASSDATCKSVKIVNDFSQPVLLQHYPFFRESDMVCNDTNRAPYPEILDKFKPKRECLSKNATTKILEKINPRTALCGHTHHACTLPFENGKGIEHTLPTFNRRMKISPTFTLATFSQNDYLLVNCYLPRASHTFGLTAIVLTMLSICSFCVWKSIHKSLQKIPFGSTDILVDFLVDFLVIWAVIYLINVS